MADVVSILSVFTPDKFKVIANDNNSYRILSLDGQLCLNILIRQNKQTIQIYDLKKCDTSGSYLLKRIDELVKKIPNIKQIQIIDASHIVTNCHDNNGELVVIDLPILQIILKGKSWYNSQGYISSNFNHEIVYNARILQTPFKDLFPEEWIEIFNRENSREKLNKIIAERTQELMEKNRNPKQDYNILYYSNVLANYEDYIHTNIESIEKECEKIKEMATELFPHINMDLPTREFVIEIYHSIGGNFTSDDTDMCEKYKFFRTLLNTIGKVIHYNFSLTKTVRRPIAGGKTKKQRKTKNTIKKKKKNTSRGKKTKKTPKT